MEEADGTELQEGESGVCSPDPRECSLCPSCLAKGVLTLSHSLKNPMRKMGLVPCDSENFGNSFTVYDK